MSIDKLIELNERKTELLKEYRESLKYEQCLYHIIEQTDRKNYFFLIEISTEKIVREGTPERLRSYLQLRKINESKVYNYKPISITY
jgi:dTDP-4-amino-4,6-dideoxygalactose transaminase